MPVELELVNLIRERLAKMAQPGLSRRDAHDAGTAPVVAPRRAASSGCSSPSCEAAETIIFLTEARADFLQGIDVPRDEPSDDAEGRGLRRLPPLRLQDGDRRGQDDRDGDAGRLEHPQQGQRPLRRAVLRLVLVVCPNVTIRDRLARTGPRATARRASTGPATWCRRT